MEFIFSDDENIRIFVDWLSPAAEATHHEIRAKLSQDGRPRCGR